MVREEQLLKHWPSPPYLKGIGQQPPRPLVGKAAVVGCQPWLSIYLKEATFSNYGAGLQQIAIDEPTKCTASPTTTG